MRASDLFILEIDMALLNRIVLLGIFCALFRISSIYGLFLDLIGMEIILNCTYEPALGTKVFLHFYYPGFLADFGSCYFIIKRRVILFS